MVDNIIEINDVKTITEILNKSFLTVAQKYGYTEENAPTFPAFIGTDIIEKQIAKGLKIYGYKREAKIIGCSGYSSENNKFIIELLAVLTEYRHSCIGKKLIEYIENEIKQKDGKIIEIHIVNNNEILKAWYIKLGYNEIKVEEYENLPFRVCIMNKQII
jgi:N-acetylglutamate synthase-like GNAT family acetyltransferase